MSVQRCAGSRTWPSTSMSGVDIGLPPFGEWSQFYVNRHNDGWLLFGVEGGLGTGTDARDEAEGENE